MKPSTEDLFRTSDKAAFQELALAVFRYQAVENAVYRAYLSSLHVHPESIQSVNQIPFLPIGFFKTHEVICGTKPAQKIFTSSGTAGAESRHFVSDLSIYEESFVRSFELFYGHVQDLAIFALLPSYLEREGSSLIYMVDHLIRLTGSRHSQFYLDNHDEMAGRLLLREAFLKQAGHKKKRNLLLGVSYALLDLAEQHQFRLENTIVMETGGMKGKRKEMIREELHEKLSHGFGVPDIHSEYGMTELLSQAYSQGKGIFRCPPWMQVIIRDTNDPFAFISDERTGGINVIDLANINSCSFIATQDLGKAFPDGSFEVLGRFDNSDLRGCNLLVG